MKLSNIRSGWTPWLVLLMGLLAFWAWAGAYTLSPKHIGWVMSGLDTPSHYLGWQFFRHAPWLQWPLGANLANGSDAPASIVLSDSIPLLALTLKLLSPWLPADFQYFGLWACSCFLLQGWFACKLVQRISDDPVIWLAGTALFLSASIFLMRVYLHPALAAQWLLLAGFHLAMDDRFRRRAWMVLLAVAVLIHAYLFVMLGLLWVADLGRRAYRKECSLRDGASHAAVAAVVVLVLMWIAGYFMPGAAAPTPLQSYADLRFPVWTGIPVWGEWSWWLPASNLDILAYDGFGYFGLGFLLLIVLALAARLRRGVVTATPQHHGVSASSWGVLWLACIVLLLYAVGNRIHFSQKILLSYPQPDWLARLRGTFRGAARMMWPFWYLLLLGTIHLLLRSVRPAVARYLLVLVVLVQLGDLSKAAVGIRSDISKRPAWHTTMVSPAWNALALHYQHVVFLQPANVPAGMVTFVPSYRGVADYAAIHHLSVNLAYLAREDDARLASARAARVALLMRGSAEPATFYVVEDDALWARLACVSGSAQWYGKIDGLRVIAPTFAPELPPLPRPACQR